MTYEICPTHLAVQAMRDNGYKNAAYAIAELIDNAIQAESTSIGDERQLFFPFNDNYNSRYLS